MDIRFLNKAAGLAAQSSDRIALYRGCSRDQTRGAICGISMHEGSQLAVSTNGHAIFGSHSEYQPEHAGKIVDKRVLLVDGLIAMESVTETYPDWTLVVPEAPQFVGVVTLPETLMWHCRVEKTRVYLSRDEVVIGADDELHDFARERQRALDAPDFRMLNADLIAGISGRAARFLWEPKPMSPVLFLPPGEAPKTSTDYAKAEILRPGNWPWFLICMPIRT